jgi:hypothetical protein
MSEFLDYAHSEFRVENRDVHVWRRHMSEFTMEEIFLDWDIERIRRDGGLGSRSSHIQRPVFRAIDYCFGRHKVAVDWLDNTKTYSMAHFLASRDMEYFRQFRECHMRDRGPMCATSACTLPLDGFEYTIAPFPPEQVIPVADALVHILSEQDSDGKDKWDRYWLHRTASWLLEQGVVTEMKESWIQAFAGEELERRGFSTDQINQVTYDLWGKHQWPVK